MVVGITGKYCSGKSFLAALFARNGYAHIEVDAVGHEALVARRDAIVDAFGPDILSSNSESTEGRKGPSAAPIDRKKLGRIVFADADKLRALEAIVHPWMADVVKERAARAAGPVVISAALLHKMGLDAFCDAVILVEACPLVRALRAMRRDHLSVLQVLRRFRNQQHIPTRKTLKKTGKTADIVTVKGVYSERAYKRALRKYFWIRPHAESRPTGDGYE